jgi:all-trans-8'-apo-beta-carotenal 15,15'-oxygenase
MHYEIDSNGRMMSPTSTALQDTIFLHDFVLTPRYRVYLLCKTVLDMKSSLLGKKTVDQGFQFTNAPTIVLVVPRDGSAPFQLEVPACFIFHFTNAFEDGAHILVDGFKYSDYPRLPAPREKIAHRDRSMGPFFTRFVIDTSRKTISEERIGEHLGDLPSIHAHHQGKPYRYAWAPSTAPDSPRNFFTGVARFDTESKTSTYRELDVLVGEALFVPNPNGAAEDDGWVTMSTYVPNAHCSDLFILDARSLATICRLRLPHHVPPGFHGTWVADRVATQ